MDVPFQVRTAGIICNNPYHASPGTKQQDFMLLAFLDGRGRYKNSKINIKLEGGMIGLITEPNDPGVLISSTSTPYTHYYCRFNGYYAKFLAKKITEEQNGSFFFSTSTQKVAQIIAKMGKITRLELPSIMGRAELLLAEALLTLLDRHIQRPEQINAETIYSWLQIHISEPFELNRLAEEFGISKSTLLRKTKKLLGKSPNRLAEEFKIEHAKTLLLLADGELNISEVAIRVGYQDSLYFSKVFKKHTGLSPLKWKNLHKQNSRALTHRKR